MFSLNRKSHHDITKEKRLKDAKPKANSRGLLSPWKQEEEQKWRLKDAERQLVRGLESPSVLKSPSYRRT